MSTASNAIIDSLDRWPFPAITEARANGHSWVEISYEHADDLFCAVPPIAIPGGFMVGEPAAHDHDGYPIHCAVVIVGGRYFARELPIDQKGRAQVLALRALVEAVS